MATRHGKLLALALAAAFAGLAVLAIALPISRVLLTQSEIEAGLERLAAIRRAERGDRGAEEAAIARLLIDGGSSSRATAEMLKHVDAIAARHGIAIRSSNVVPSKPDGELGEISIQISYEAGISAVRGLVHEIETGRPIVIIDDLNMRTIASASESIPPDAAARLDVTMTLSSMTKSREER